MEKKLRITKWNLLLIVLLLVLFYFMYPYAILIK